MPYVYYGYTPRGRGATKLAVETDDGVFEPMEPSKVKVFTQVVASFVYSSMVSCLGLVIGILSYAPFTYYSINSPGLMVQADDTTSLPFSNPGLALVLNKGGRLPDADVLELEKRGFTSMSFASRTVFLKEEPTDLDYHATSDIRGLDHDGPSPVKYLNQNAFEAWLILGMVLKKICQLFHYIGQHGGELDASHSTDPHKDHEAKGDLWSYARRELSHARSSYPTSPFEFLKSKTYLFRGGEAAVAQFVKVAGGGSGISVDNSRVVVNPFDGPPAPGFIKVSDISSIKTDGIIMKFHPRLALPDPNLISDVLGRYFMQALGDSREDQIENLAIVKRGLSQLRLTRVGDEITHLMKTLEIAIANQSGMIPFFNNKVYEGSLICGGIGGEIIIQDRVYSYQDTTSLKNDFLNVSTHAAALNKIANLFPADRRALVLACDSMRKLWAHCLLLETTRDVQESIVRLAANLDFGNPPWPITPHNLQKAFLFMTDQSSIPLNAPISRLSLFSRDPVLLALGCFGEKSAPSWDIPQGVQCSITRKNPPVPIVEVKKRKGQAGQISDATWVMVVRRTDLISAVEEFKHMASVMKYRSTSSVIAKKVGHLVFSRERMAEFWQPMQLALKVVNPKMSVDQEESSSRKRVATLDTVEEDAPVAKKGRFQVMSETMKQLKGKRVQDLGKGEKATLMEAGDLGNMEEGEIQEDDL